MTELTALIAFEESAVLRTELTRRGWDAISCDLKPTAHPGKHYQGDVRDILDQGWDLIIAHPDCTYLCRSGQHWLHAPDDHRPGKLKGAPRWAATQEAVEMFQLLQNTPAPFMAIENPRPGSHVARELGRPDDNVQPWMFGDEWTKETRLWLRNLPPLMMTNNVYAHMMTLPEKERSRIHRASPGPKRSEERSKTAPGMAAAMADQWGGHIETLVVSGAYSPVHDHSTNH